MRTTQQNVALTAPGLQNGAGHLMSSEIAEQPSVFQRLCGRARDGIYPVAHALARRDIRVILLAARGSSDNAAVYGKYLAETMLGLPAGLVSPSVTTVYDAHPDLRQTLHVCVSQSGASTDLVQATARARRCGAITLTLTNTPDSALANESDFVIDVAAGPERAVAATKSYTAELLGLFLLLSSWAQDRSTASAAAGLADAASATIHACSALDLVTRYRFATQMVTVGRGFSYATAREAALKIMETSYVGAHAYSGADLLHGPVSMIDEATPVIAITTPNRGGAAMADVIASVEARGADVLQVSAAESDRPSLLPVTLGGVSEELHPLLEILPLQSFALMLALDRGLNPDSPRGLAKVTLTS